MGFQVSIAGTIEADDATQVEAKEQALADALRAVLVEHDAAFDYAQANFDYSGVQDLMPAPPAAPGEPPAGGETTEQGAGPEPDEGPLAPAVFVQKITDEGYSDYLARVDAWNTTHPEGDPARIEPFAEDVWSELAVG